MNDLESRLVKDSVRRNPSIERMLPVGLRPLPGAAHVKR